MASGYITGSTGNQYIEARIFWVESIDIASNTSTLTLELYYKRTNDYTTYGTGTFSITVDGEKKTKTNYISFSDEAWVKAMSAIFEVEHEDDGTKHITISASGSIPGTTLTSTSVYSEYFSLEQIPRASSILSSKSTELGTSCAVAWNPLHSTYHYKLHFELGDWELTTGVISPNSVKTYTYKGEMPLSLAEQIPNSAKGTMKVTLYTYSDSAGKKQLGSADSDTFTVTVPNNSDTKPTLNLFLSPVHSLGENFDGLYIKGRSKVQASYTATGKYGASIAFFELYVSGKKSPSAKESGYLSTAGTVKVKGRVTDTRGYTKEVEKSITVIDYSAPVILPSTNDKAIVCARCYADGTLADDGTYLRILAKRSYSKVMSDGEQHNFCTIRYRYRQESTNTYSAWRTLLDGEDTGADTVDSGAIAGVVANTEMTYFVQVGVIDDVGETDAVQFVVPTDFVTIDCPEDFKGRRIGLFRHVSGTTADGLYVGLPIFGGSVDSLKLGTRLTATATAPISLDDQKTPGIYYSPNAENSQYIANTPYTAGGFGLEVRELQNVNFIGQTIFYGRTRGVRHFDGASWSEWVRFMVSTEFETACEDYVIDSGTSNGWTYKKWKKGTYEMFGEFAVAPGTSSLNGTVYRTDSISIPAPFAIVDAMVSGTAVGFYWLSNGGKSGTSAVNIRIISDKAITASTITVRLHVVGTYA